MQSTIAPYGSADGGNSSRAMTVLQTSANLLRSVQFPLLSNFHSFYYRNHSFTDISSLFFFVYLSAYSNITSQALGYPPMSLCSVVSIPQCCISTTVAMSLHNVERYRPIPYYETIQGYTTM